MKKLRKLHDFDDFHFWVLPGPKEKTNSLQWMWTPDQFAQPKLREGRLRNSFGKVREILIHQKRKTRRPKTNLTRRRSGPLGEPTGQLFATSSVEKDLITCNILDWNRWTLILFERSSSWNRLKGSLVRKIEVTGWFFNLNSIIYLVWCFLDSGISGASLEPTPTSEYSDFPRVILTEESEVPRTTERSRLLDEKVKRQQEEFIDPDTGKKYMTTTETTEKTLEHEVNFWFLFAAYHSSIGQLLNGVCSTMLR